MLAMVYCLLMERERDFTVSLDLPLMPPVPVEIGSNSHLRYSGKVENSSGWPIPLIIPPAHWLHTPVLPSLS